MHSMLAVLYNVRSVVYMFTVYNSVLCSAFVAVQIQCLLTNSWHNYLQKMLALFIILVLPAISANSPFLRAGHILLYTIYPSSRRRVTSLAQEGGRVAMTPALPCQHFQGSLSKNTYRGSKDQTDRQTTRLWSKH